VEALVAEISRMITTQINREPKSPQQKKRAQHAS